MQLWNEDSFKMLPDMADDSVDAIITDSPYDLLPVDISFLYDQFIRISKGAVIVFCYPENQWYYGSSVCQYLFWIKPISTKNTSKSYSRFVEMIQVWNGGVWNCKGHWSNYVNVFQDYVEGELVHPFQKPLSLVRRLIYNHTNVGGIVLDPFMGSGTTGMAALLEGREFKGIEKDEEYFRLAEQRIGNYDLR